MNYQISKKGKFLTWFLIILSYVFSYGSALVASYFYLAKDHLGSSAGKGGGFFYTVVGIILITLIISTTKLINKMGANVFKTIFKGLMKIGIIFVIKFATSYVSLNFQALTNVLSFTVLGMMLGTITEMIAVQKYGDYIREVGVL